MEVRYGADVGYFLWSLATGGLLGLVYDLLRTARRVARTSSLTVNIEDIFFCLLAAGLLFWTAYDKNGGRLRWQGILGTAGGFGAYRFLLRDRLVRLLAGCWALLARLALWTVRILLFPAAVVCRALRRPILVIGWYTRQGVRRGRRLCRTRQERRRTRRLRRQAEAKQRKKHRKKTPASPKRGRKKQNR